MSNLNIKEIFIATNGSDSNSGTIESPFLTLERAKQEVNTLKQDTTLNKIVVYLRGGRYTINDTFTLTEADSGSENLAIVYSGYNGEKVEITGGETISWDKFSKVTSPEELDRLKDSAKGKVYVADLKGEKAAEFLNWEMNMKMQDFDYDTMRVVTDLANVWAKATYPILCSNGYALQLAQFPNRGYANIEKIIDKGSFNRNLQPGDEIPKYSIENPIGGSFKLFEEFDTQKWQKELAHSGEIYCDGHISNDWYTDENYVGKISDNGDIKLLKTTRYGVESSDDVFRRICFKNILCELDEPGEWYFDKKAEKLYVMPIDLKEGEVPQYEVPKDLESLITLENATNVTIQNMNFESFKDMAIHIVDGKNNLVAGCLVKNGIEFGVCIDGGFNNGITSCDIHSVNQAIRANGGDIKTITHCDNFITNNHIYRCRFRGYGVVTVEGCGLRFANNLLHDMSCSYAMKTVDGICELNEMYNIGQEMGDFNCGYIGTDFWTQGNYFKNNFIHHMMRYKGIKHLGGLRHDGEGMGTYFVSNVFFKAGTYCVAATGALSTVTGNIAVETPVILYSDIFSDEDIKKRWAVIEASRKGEIFAGDTTDQIYRMELLIGEKGWEKEPWISRFPKLKEAIESNPWGETYSTIARNYTTEDVEKAYEFHGKGLHTREREKTFVMEKPLSIPSDVFENYENLNFKVKDEFEFVEGFEKIPFEKIGLYQDEYRTQTPNKDEYRHEVYMSHKDEESSEKIIYDRERANKQYPLPLYLVK